MKGSDLKCEACGLPAVNVAPDYTFDEAREAVSWCCTKGHYNTTGWHPPPPKIQGLNTTLETLKDYKLKSAPVVISGLEHLKDPGREEFLKLVEARIDALHATVSRQLAEAMYAPDPWWSQVTHFPPPRRWMWRIRLRWWWRDAREWFAEKVLRVDIHQREDDE